MERYSYYKMQHSGRISRLLIVIFMLTGSTTFAQSKNPVIESIVAEATDNSQLEKLAHELLDVIGPRLVGTPQMKQSNDWAEIGRAHV